MFRKNTQHLQPALISAVNELPAKQRTRLETSWAGTFYQEFFCRIEEEAFAVLYAEQASRPNVPVNVLVSLEALKAGFGWSDQELYDNYCYNLQVRYAVGYDRLGDGAFELRSLYNFRRRLSQYHAEEGVNLLEAAFEQITDAQIERLKVRTGMQRMDSTQIASNIVAASRLRLLVEGVQRVARLLSQAEQERLAEVLAPYTQGSAGQYTYRVKGKAALQAHLQRLGQHIHTLLQALQPNYAAEPAYQVLQRLFSEHFHLAADAPQPKAAGELTAASLQSVDDLEATYRSKRGQGYRGYVANVTETCDPENELQLITKVQVAPNNVDDDQLLAEALPNLKARTDVESLRTDGGYGGAASDPLLQQHGVELLQSAIRGRQPNPEQFHLADFEIRLDENGAPLQLTCPQGQPAAVQLSSRKKSFVADFAPEVCAACPLAKQCPAKPGKRHPRYRLRFTQTQAQAALRRQRHRALTPAARNLRAAVEATVRSVKHPFPGGKLPVRGRLRVTCLLIGSAAITNIRRITRYRKRQKQPPRQPKNTQNQPIEAPKTGDTPFLSLLRTCWRCLLAPHRSVCPLAGC